jgi:hypothetical protein
MMREGLPGIEAERVAVTERVVVTDRLKESTM